MKFHPVVVFLLGIGALGLGCNGPGTIAEPVEVRGTAAFAGGKPVADVKLNLNPMDQGLPGTAKLGADGQFTLNLVPGKYAYSFEPLDGKPAAYRVLPGKYHSPHEDHTIEVAAGKTIAITVK